MMLGRVCCYVKFARYASLFHNYCITPNVTLKLTIYLTMTDDDPN